MHARNFQGTTESDHGLPVPLIGLGAYQKLYMAGFNVSIDRYRELLTGLGGGRFRLPNHNFDMGEAMKAGKYKLADAAYAKLLHKLERHYVDLRQDLRSAILAF